MMGNDMPWLSAPLMPQLDRIQAQCFEERSSDPISWTVSFGATVKAGFEPRCFPHTSTLRDDAGIRKTPSHTSIRALSGVSHTSLQLRYGNFTHTYRSGVGQGGPRG